ncbi:hypothetical protein N7454_004700 [Penicillium verhagenii]|nr:hypothetical protein N7454_004700 [Penicillium verhagenii]
MGFRITTWNVNGIRNPFSYEPWRGTRTFESMFQILESDIVVFQETKIQRKDLRDDMVLVPGWDCYFSLPKYKKGYSGVVIYTRNATCAPIRAEEGITGVLCPPNSSVAFRDMPKDQQIGGYPTLSQLTDIGSLFEPGGAEDDDEQGATAEERIDAATLDSEGRCVVLEFPAFVLIGTYCPAQRDETRDSFRLDFLNALDARIRNLVSLGKKVFVTGDINISKNPIDSAHMLESIRKNTATELEFHTSPPRRLFNALLADGVVVGGRDDKEQPVLHDICRSFHPGRAGMYTCWDTRLNTRPGNYGSRIDYVLCSLEMQEWFSDSNIQEGLLGSDHCPVYAVFKDQVPHDGKTVFIRDIVNPPGMFKDGERQKEYSTQYLLPTSGRLLPEFDLDKRRSIKDMFARKPSNVPSRSPSAASGVKNPTSAVSNDQASPTNSQNDTVTTPSDVSTSNSLTRKRPPQPPSVPAKRSKSTTAPSPISKAGQKTLKGFFKPKAASNSTPSQPPANEMSVNTSGLNEGTSLSKSSAIDDSSMIDASQATESTGEAAAASTQTSSIPPSPSRPDDDTVFDPIVSKEDWSKLFTKKPVPRCDSHEEPCVSLTTKKPGMNRGRAFYICSRPIGPSGQLTKGTQWRCPTFIWASDWNGSSQGHTEE